MWAAKAVRFGYFLKIRNGKQVLFWLDRWHGNCYLATSFLDLFQLVNEKNITIARAWEVVDLKLTLSRCADQRTMDRWHELLAVVKSLNVQDEPDVPVWKFTKSGVYTSASFYDIVNLGCISPKHSQFIWEIVVPVRIHVFLWLLLHNKILTR